MCLTLPYRENSKLQTAPYFGNMGLRLLGLLGLGVIAHGLFLRDGEGSVLKSDESVMFPPAKVDLPAKAA